MGIAKEKYNNVGPGDEGVDERENERLKKRVAALEANEAFMQEVKDCMEQVRSAAKAGDRVAECVHENPKFKRNLEFYFGQKGFKTKFGFDEFEHISYTTFWW